MSKISLHIIGNAPDWAEEYLQISGAGTIKGMIQYPKIPGIRTVGRVYDERTKEPEPIASYIRRGAAGAVDVFNIIRPEIEKNTHVDIWEPYNETPIWQDDVLRGFVPFNQRLIQLFHEHGWKIMVGAINTYWPQPHQYPYVAQACQGADGLSFHEYAKQNMMNDADICHYRDFHRWCGANGYQHPPVYITETGLDKIGGDDHGHYGWRSILMGNENEYVNQLIWYEYQLRQDEYVRAAHVFTTGGGWPDFEFDKSVALKLARRLAELPWPNGGEPEPEPEPPPNGGGEDMPVIDERIRDFVSVNAGGDTWKVESVEWKDPDEAHGLHHIYVRAYDENGARVVGLPVACKNGGTAVGYTEAKPPEEWGDVNFGMTGTLGSYRVQVNDPNSGSDVVMGMGLGTPQEPTVNHHTAFVITFQKASPDNGGEPEPPEPEPPDPDPPSDELKEMLYAQIDIVQDNLMELDAELAELRQMVDGL